MSIITNVRVYDLEQSITASGYPMLAAPPSPADDADEEKHINRAIRLGSAPRGSGHDNFLKGIRVSFDLCFTVKAWTEAERYHFFDIVSSMSSMHCLTKMDFDECFNGYVTENTRAEMKRLLNIWKENPTAENELALLYNYPTGLKLTARISTNYQQLKTIYAQRKNHKLPEWREFCAWIKDELPFAEQFICV